VRVGVDTIKPDPHVLNFVETTLGFRLTDAEAVSILDRVARDLKVGRVAARCPNLELSAPAYV